MLTILADMTRGNPLDFVPPSHLESLFIIAGVGCVLFWMMSDFRNKT